MTGLITSCLLFIALFSFIGWVSYQEYKVGRDIIEAIKKRGCRVIKIGKEKDD